MKRIAALLFAVWIFWFQILDLDNPPEGVAILVQFGAFCLGLLCLIFAGYLVWQTILEFQTLEMGYLPGGAGWTRFWATLKLRKELAQEVKLIQALGLDETETKALIDRAYARYIERADDLLK